MSTEPEVSIERLAPDGCDWRRCRLAARYLVRMDAIPRPRQYKSCARHRHPFGRLLSKEYRRAESRRAREEREVEERRTASQQFQDRQQRELRERIKAAGPSYPLTFGPGVSPERRQQIMQQLAERG